MEGNNGASRLTSAQELLQLIGSHDVDKAMSFLSDDVTYRVPGKQGLSGDYVGRDGVARHLVDVYEETKGTFDPLKWEDWMVGTDHVAVLAKISMERQAAIMTGRFLYLLRFNGDDKIDGIELFVSDPEQVKRFFQ
ncbi:MAG TPA: nuclear transport factor 2 family protein [Acidimicrobiales bacterium]|jgi:ketosteroid isomerase-like protein